MYVWHTRRQFITIRFRLGGTLHTCIYHLLRNYITKRRFSLTYHVVRMYRTIEKAVLTFVAVKRELIDGMTWHFKSVLFHHVVRKIHKIYGYPSWDVTNNVINGWLAYQTKVHYNTLQMGCNTWYLCVSPA